MNKKTFLLEIGCEEIPSRFMPDTLQALQEEAGKIFAEYRLLFDSIATLGTPRRLVLLVEGLAERQENLSEKKKGPARKIAFDLNENPTRAAEGFARSQGIKVNKLTVEKVAGIEYIFALTKTVGKETQQVLPVLLPELVRRLNFPRPMFWASREVRFARPIRWLLALYGEEMIEFSYGKVKSEAKTYGHRFLAPGPHPVSSPAEYFSLLKEAYVILNPEERQRKILREAQETARALGGKALLAEDLLEEVNFLVEYPLALSGAFAPEYLKLPREVLITTMQKHQRYFPVETQTGELLPYFIIIANGTKSFSENVRKGNEKVLRARLADADFFYREDLKEPLAEKVSQLKSIVYQEELGSLWDKTLRLKSLSRRLALLLNLQEEEKEMAIRAAYLSKADLVSSIVYEFPELQGIMGREYALASGENKKTALAIFEHYLPRFAGDASPQSLPGAVVALADKLDNIMAAFFLGKEPTGSQDPYALRRQALGIITILRSHRISLDLKALLGDVYDSISSDADPSAPKEETIIKVWEFVLQRMRFVLLEEGLRHDVLEALFSSHLQDINLISRRSGELQEMLADDSLAGLLTTYTRVANLATKAAAEIKPNQELLQEKEEQELYSNFLVIKEVALEFLSQGDFKSFLNKGTELKPFVDTFFEAVMVMVEDEELRLNRLALLKEIRDFFLQTVDLSKIVVNR